MARSIHILFCVVVVMAGCASPGSKRQASGGSGLVGAWRSKIQFDAGALAGIKGLEFMYVFNAGGTMTESSNFDAAPPVPPAYGVWRRTGPKQFEAKYAYYSTRAPAHFEEIARGGGWPPAGNGVFIEKITLAEDGKSFKSTIHFEIFEIDGQPADGGGDGFGESARIDF